VLTMSW